MMSSACTTARRRPSTTSVRTLRARGGGGAGEPPPLPPPAPAPACCACWFQVSDQLLTSAPVMRLISRTEAPEGPAEEGGGEGAGREAGLWVCTPRGCQRWSF